MSFEIGETPDRDDLAQFPKVARQHELAARGIRVPPGVVLDLATARVVFGLIEGRDDPALEWVREQLREPLAQRRARQMDLHAPSLRHREPEPKPVYSRP